MEDGLLSLKWNNHKRTFTKAISQYRDQALYSDVTLACKGKYFHAHKIILSSCSEYFQEIFTITQCKQPVIVLKDIRPVDIEQLLQYIYIGEVDVKQSELAELIKAAECLKIKGLATPDDDTEDEIPKKKKRKRLLSGERPDSPQKQTNSSPSNINSDTSMNLQPSQSHLNEPKELVKAEPIDIDIIEEISTKSELDKLEDKNMNYDDNSSIVKYDNYLEKELPYIENEPLTENLVMSNPSIPVEYLPEYESTAGPSVISEDSSFDNSTFLDDSSANQDLALSNFEDLKYCIRKKIGKLTIYNCTLCQFNNAEKSKFVVHVRTHTGEKPFKCRHCNYRSAQKVNAQRHERIMHTSDSEKTYGCSLCPYRSAHKQNLRLHEKRKHYYIRQ